MTAFSLPVIGITMGDPAGVGPEIIVKSFGHSELHGWCRPLVIGDANRLREAARIVGSALIVKVDNTPKGYVQQEGIDKADIVFVEQTEQGTTRLAAVFQSQDTTVGPVRSARTSDVGIAGALNHPMLAYSGANGGVLRQVRSGPLVDVGIDASGMAPIYLKNQRGTIKNLYRYFLPTVQVYAAKGAQGKTPPPLFRYRAAGEAATGNPVANARVGKLIEFDFAGDDPAGEAKKMCETLLANTVIESYRIEVA